jgi:predicted ATPase
LARFGQVADGLAAIEKALALTERIKKHWIIVELLRVKRELLLMQDASGAAPAAEDLFRRALDGARRHEALSWELHAATNLARLPRDQGRAAEALALLQPVYDQLTEEFETADLKAEGPSRRFTRAWCRGGKSGAMRRPSLKNPKFPSEAISKARGGRLREAIVAATQRRLRPFS